MRCTAAIDGCVESHPYHYCKGCKNPKSNHRYRNCNSKRLRCMATGCTESHTDHYCYKCHNPRATHRTRNCPNEFSARAGAAGAAGAADTTSASSSTSTNPHLGDASHHGQQLTPTRPPKSQAEGQRRNILLDTLRLLDSSELRDVYQFKAISNLCNWQDQKKTTISQKIIILQEDWGEVAARLTREYGSIFAVLNMANALGFGGGYVNGCAAQEENMFRRTDCHFADTGIDRQTGRYLPAMSDLINGFPGRVYLDMKKPRVCIKSGEDSSLADLGYKCLADEEIFPFYELRAAAVDLSKGGHFDKSECRRRIDAQLDTLIEANQRHVILSAFGCGAFANPATSVAQAYRESIELRHKSFDVIAFAIYNPGYGPSGNFDAFNKEFHGFQYD
jgi:hypothetical protein